MGIPVSIMNKMGLSKKKIIDKIYDRYFSKTPITKVEEFHEAFIDLCRDLNSIMPGKQYYLPPRGTIKNFFDHTWMGSNEDERKGLLITFMCENVKESNSGNAMILIGLATPPAAIYLKKATDNIPLAKMFRLHLIPNFAFVPSFTLLSVVAMKLIQKYQKPNPTI